jgi:hypothetical protein
MFGYIRNSPWLKWGGLAVVLAFLIKGLLWLFVVAMIILGAIVG